MISLTAGGNMFTVFSSSWASPSLWAGCSTDKIVRRFVSRWSRSSFGTCRRNVSGGSVLLRAAAANKFHCVKLVMSCMNHVYVLEPGQLNEDRKAQQHHLSKISWRSLWVRGGGGEGGMWRARFCWCRGFLTRTSAVGSFSCCRDLDRHHRWLQEFFFVFFLCLQHDLS